MAERVFIINPGSTSTKIACYDGPGELFSESIAHPQTELMKFDGIPEQTDYRLGGIREAIFRHKVNLGDLDIVMGRGGMFPPVKGGAYLVDDEMVELIRRGDIEQHASNLGGLLARMIADEAGVKAFVYDCVSVDEFPPICKVTGIPEINRQSFCHALNSREAARRYAQSTGRKYEEVNCVVAHLGGGISFSAHSGGRIVDSIADDAGSFAPERGGSVPVLYIVDMCFSGKYTQKEMCRKVRGMGGLRALLGTSDCREVEARISSGDSYAKEIYDAMIFQIAKGIHMVSTILAGNIDAVILTGGVAYSKYITDMVTEYVRHFGEVVVIPGEHEMEALAGAGVRLLHGEVYHTLSGGDGNLC
jgi:butyrate kinase